jgi:hypothetical protein
MACAWYGSVWHWQGSSVVKRKVGSKYPYRDGMAVCGIGKKQCCKTKVGSEYPCRGDGLTVTIPDTSIFVIK